MFVQELVLSTIFDNTLWDKNVVAGGIRKCLMETDKHASRRKFLLFMSFIPFKYFKIKNTYLSSEEAGEKNVYYMNVLSSYYLEIQFGKSEMNSRTIGACLVYNERCFQPLSSLVLILLQSTCRRLVRDANGSLCCIYIYITPRYINIGRICKFNSWYILYRIQRKEWDIR